MAFEPSEGLYAGLSFVSTSDLNAAKSDINKFKDLYFVALETLKTSNKIKDGAGNQTRNGLIKEIDLTDNKDPKKEKEIYSDLAGVIGAVLATRTKALRNKIPTAVYLTGNKWHSDVEKFKINAYGMADYNSSDLILKSDDVGVRKHYTGISLKKKRKLQNESPTMINNAFSKFIEGNDFVDVRKGLDEHRKKFFAGVIKEAAQPGNPLALYARANKSISSLDPDKLSDAEILWNTKIVRMKNGKPKKEALINLKSESDLADLTGDVLDPKVKDEFRKFVNEKLGSTTSKLNPLFQGFLDIMNRKDVKDKLANGLLNRVLKLKLLDELSTWKSNQFDFYLIEGVGDYNPTNQTATISNASVYDIHSVIVEIARMTKEPAIMELDDDSLKPGKAKVKFILKKGKLPILKIELRYKGSFTAMPQFFATMTDEFKEVLHDAGDITRI
jgi:hypothetical protein